MEKYIIFNREYVGVDSKIEYLQGVKFVIKDIKDGYCYFMNDKIEMKFLHKLFEIGNIKIPSNR